MTREQLMSLFDPAVRAQLEAEQAKRIADHNLVVTLGTGLSFEAALAKAKQETKAKRLHLRGWQQHPQDPRFYFRPIPDGCESKLETALAAAWPSVDLCESPIEVAYYDVIVGRYLCDYQLRLQQEAVCGGGTYRVDFLFLHPRLKTVCVEIDGHDYHERTKEQAQYDKQRDRRLALLGWRVLRFTGSEIFRDAEICAQETVQHLEALTRG